LNLVIISWWPLTWPKSLLQKTILLLLLIWHLIWVWADRWFIVSKWLLQFLNVLIRCYNVSSHVITIRQSKTLSFPTLVSCLKCIWGFPSWIYYQSLIIAFASHWSHQVRLLLLVMSPLSLHLSDLLMLFILNVV
jgi:hypothetical protein